MGTGQDEELRTSSGLQRAQEPLLLHPTPKHPWAPGWGGLNPSAGTSRDRAVAGTEHPLLQGGCSCAGGDGDGAGGAVRAGRTSSSRMCKSCSSPSPAAGCKGSSRGRRSVGCPVSQRMLVLSNTPGKGGPGGSRACPVSAQTLHWIKSLAAGCVLPSWM